MVPKIYLLLLYVASAAQLTVGGSHGQTLGLWTLEVEVEALPVGKERDTHEHRKVHVTLAGMEESDHDHLIRAFQVQLLGRGSPWLCIGLSPHGSQEQSSLCIWASLSRCQP